MDGGGVGGVHCVVDSEDGWRVLEGLVSRDVAELLLEKAVDSVDGIVPARAEDVDVAYAFMNTYVATLLL